MRGGNAPAPLPGELGTRDPGDMCALVTPGRNAGGVGRFQQGRSTCRGPGGQVGGRLGSRRACGAAWFAGTWRVRPRTGTESRLRSGGPVDFYFS